MAKMSAEEKRQWDDLYQYVKCNIMNYDDNQSLSKQMVLRLKGLQTNKYMENKNIDSMANYSFEVILNTFKCCSVAIKRALSTPKFNSEMHKFNYVLKIVEPQINDIYLRMKDAKKQQENIETANKDNMEYALNNNVKYKPTNKNNTGARVKELW